MIQFYKYQGAGNDFILIDNRERIFSGDKISLAQKWCDRKFGIGSDGLIFIEEDVELAFTMDFYNPDGSQSFCGNGSRCAVAFAHLLNIFQGKKITFRAIDGPHEAELVKGGVKIGMNQIGGIREMGGDEFIDTGSPHYISYEGEDQEPRDIVDFGRSIRYAEPFKESGTNVNLVEILPEQKIRVRTYERGVEDETFACGTGATACGISYATREGLQEGVIDVAVKGGDLKIHLKQGAEKGVFEEIWLEGPAEKVFRGEIPNG